MYANGSNDKNNDKRHTNNSWPSCMCVIQEYRYITISLGQYHGCCLYHESMSITCVHVNTMSPNTCQESMSIIWVHVYTMSPCVYHVSMSIPWLHVNTMSLCLYHEFMYITWVIVHVMSWFLYCESRNSNNRKTKFKLQEDIKKITEIQFLEIQKFKSEKFPRKSAEIQK